MNYEQPFLFNKLFFNMNCINNNISFIILSGGKNSRYGGINKAFIKVEGVKILDRLINTATQLVNEIIIVTNDPESYNEYNTFKITSDHYKEIGPLAGIHAGLKVITHQAAIVVSCDMPFVKKEIITQQIDIFHQFKPDVLIPSHKNKIEPLHAIYSKTILPEIEAQIRSGSYAIRKMFPRLDVYNFTPSDVNLYEQSIININSPEEFERFTN